MTSKIVVGLRGTDADERALGFAKRMAELFGDTELILCHVVEWSPYTFQTPEENAQRHKRREEEIKVAHERVIDPLVEVLKAEGFAASGLVRHGDAAEVLNGVGLKERAEQIVVTRSAASAISARVFGTVATKLAATASLPVTIVG